MVRAGKKKDVWLEDITYGQHIENVILGIRNIVERADWYCFTLYDRSASLDARIPKGCIDGSLSEGIYSLTISVKMEKGNKVAIVRDVKEPPQGSYSVMDIQEGLEPDRVEELKKKVKGAAGLILKGEREGVYSSSYGKLLKNYFSQEEIDMLAILPASIADAGRYRGGALALVAGVAELCRLNKQALEGALKNGLYDSPCDYPLMLTACLLSMAGMRDYVDENLNKSQRGVIREYHSLLQSKVERLIYESQLPQLEGDKLLNCLHCMFPGGGRVKAVTIEGAICRQVLGLWKEIDEISYELSQAEESDGGPEGVFYSTHLERPFLVVKTEEVAV